MRLCADSLRSRCVRLRQRLISQAYQGHSRTNTNAGHCGGPPKAVASARRVVLPGRSTPPRTTDRGLGTESGRFLVRKVRDRAYRAGSESSLSCGDSPSVAKGAATPPGGGSATEKNGSCDGPVHRLSSGQPLLARADAKTAIPSAKRCARDEFITVSPEDNGCETGEVVNGE